MKESRVIVSVLWGRQKGLALEKSRLCLNTGVHYLCNLDLSSCSLWDLNLLQKSRMKNTFYELYCENQKWIMKSAWPWQMLKEKVMSPFSTVFLTSVPDIAHLSQSSYLQRFFFTVMLRSGYTLPTLSSSLELIKAQMRPWVW